MNTTTTDYQLALSPWVLWMHTTDSSISAVGRFRNRNDAEQRSLLVKRDIPHAKFEILYSPNN